jgi:F0F1-type ATP synthase membrane subunit c/vacuolar-type H+-ATPase subunit K
MADSRHITRRAALVGLGAAGAAMSTGITLASATSDASRSWKAGVFLSGWHSTVQTG